MILGVVGKIRSGKTTIAKYVCEKFGFEIRSMAKPLKEAAKVIFDWNDEHVYGELKDRIDERFGISPRQVLQHLGTEWSQFSLCKSFPEFERVTGRKIWAKNFALEYESRLKPRNIVIDDLRFQHEIDMVKAVEKNSFILQVLRPGLNSDDHASELQKDLKQIDAFVNNDSDILELLEKVSFMMDIVQSRVYTNINNFLLSHVCK